MTPLSFNLGGLAGCVRAVPVRSPLEDILDRSGPTDMVTLDEVDALIGTDLEDVLAGHELRDRPLAESAGDVDDRGQDQPVGVVRRTLLDELPVDLHEVEGQVLEV